MFLTDEKQKQNISIAAHVFFKNFYKRKYNSVEFEIRNGSKYSEKLQFTLQKLN